MAQKPTVVKLINGSPDPELNVPLLSGQQLATTQLLGKTSPAQSIAAFATPNDGVPHLYLCFAGVVITAFTSGQVTPQIVFTDESGTVRTQSIVVAAGLGYVSATPLTFMAQPDTIVTVSTVGTLVGTFDVFAAVLQVS